MNEMKAAVPVFVVLCAAIATAGCAHQSTALPAELIANAAKPMPTPWIASNDAPPQLLAMRFSSLVVHRGHVWTGRFVTSSNVASVEVRTNLFSIDVPRTQPGRFAYVVNVLDVPPIFVRSYRLRVIARNSAGTQLERDLPFTIR